MALNVFLSPSAQTQLAQLKAANAAPLTRIDTQRNEVSALRKAATNVQAEITQVKDALAAVRSADADSMASAVKSFIAEYNQLAALLGTVTGKDGALAKSSELRMSRVDLRSPFQSIDTLQALRAIGVQTTRSGVAATDPGSATSQSPPMAALDALSGALDRVATRFTSTVARFDQKLSRLTQSRDRAQLQVDRVNTRTEQNFLKMYQVTQAMNSASGSSGASALFSAFA